MSERHDPGSPKCGDRRIETRDDYFLLRHDLDAERHAITAALGVQPWARTVPTWSAPRCN